MLKIGFEKFRACERFHHNMFIDLASSLLSTMVRPVQSSLRRRTTGQSRDSGSLRPQGYATTCGRDWIRVFAGFALACLSVLALVQLEGCASLPPSAKAESTALPANDADPLVQLANASTPPGPGSSFRPMPFSRISMDTRLALAKRAVHTLDLQYYLIQNDSTGKTLLRAVILRTVHRTDERMVARARRARADPQGSRNHHPRRPRTDSIAIHA